MKQTALFPTILILLLAALACNIPGNSAGALTPSPTLTLTETPVPTATATFTPSATVTATNPVVVQPTPFRPTFTPLPRATNPPGPQFVNIYLIAIEDNGASGKKIGCNDSVIPVRVQIEPTQGVLRAALSRLLAIDDQYYGESGLYNALYQSDLTISSLSIQNGVATMRLSGTLTLGGVCDNPRVKAQLEETALQFSTVKSVNIFINNTPIDELLSGEG